MFQNGICLGIGINHLDVGAVKHDLFDRAFAQVQSAQNSVAIFFFDNAFGVTQMQSPGNLFTNGQNVAVRVDLNSEQAQDPPDQHTHGGHNRRKQGDHHADDRCYGCGGLF